MSELRPLTHGQYGDDDAHSSAQGTVENNEEPKTNREPTSNLLQESTQQLATSPTPPSPSPSSVSAGPQGGRIHPTPLHSTLGGPTFQELLTELEKEKKLKNDAESELAAALRRETAALREKEAALKREEAALREKAALEEERKKFSAVMSQLGEEGDTLRKKLRPPGGTEPPPAPIEPLNRATPGVEKVGANVLCENIFINNCRTEVTIHEGLEELLEALFRDQTKLGKTLYQNNVEKGVVYWSFMINNTKSCDLLMGMRVEERQDEERMVIRVESVHEKELESKTLPNPHSTASKKLRLLIKEGTIVLRPLQFGQTLFTFKAQVDVVEEKFRRNGKEVDREGVATLAKVIKKRRGVALMEDQTSREAMRNFYKEGGIKNIVEK
ncbi:hypothetical protein TrST_g13115 [Triparma strigata]|uniref:Uncharacterized protein n=1 Tax=Triparma strigata TaxID=1606541 RepID=A0A9W7B4L3_9STRA|nr:hypothetical protein TrST_g13115 [Triparma strigata]